MNELIVKYDLNDDVALNNLLDALRNQTYEGILILSEYPAEIWKALNDSDIHLGMRGAKWGIVKDIPVVTINGTKCVFCIDESDPRYTFFSSGDYATNTIDPVTNFDIIDLCDPKLSSCLAKLDGKLQGWDFETRGFPLEPGFKPLGFSLVTDKYGLYIDFRYYTDYSADIYKELHDYLVRNQRFLITYNCKFEMQCFLNMFNEYIYPLDAMALLSCDDMHTNLKAAAQMYLSVPSWDDELDEEQKMLYIYNAFLNHNKIEKILEEINNCNILPKKKGESPIEKFLNTCLQMDMKDVPEFIEQTIKKNRLIIDPTADLEPYKSIKEGIGNPWEQCYPPSLAKYCILDSYYTLKLWEKVAPKYSQLCIDVFHKNYYQACYLGSNPMPIRTDELEKVIRSNRLISNNTDLAINRIYGEMLEDRYKDIDIDSLFSPVEKAIIESGNSELLDESPEKILKTIAIEALETKNAKKLAAIYGKSAAMVILSTITLDDKRARKVWTQLVTKLNLGSNNESGSTSARVNKIINKRFIDYIEKFNSIAEKCNPLPSKDMNKMAKYRRVLNMTDSDINKISNIKLKSFFGGMDEKLKGLMLDWISPENMEYILNAPNPHYAKYKNQTAFNKLEDQTNRYTKIQDLIINKCDEAGFNDDLVGFSRGNFMRYRDWIPIQHIFDLIVYRANKKYYDTLDNYKYDDEIPNSHNPDWKRMVNIGSDEDSFKLFDLIEKQFHNVVGRIIYESDLFSKHEIPFDWDRYWSENYTPEQVTDIRILMYPIDMALGKPTEEDEESLGMRGLLLSRWGYARSMCEFYGKIMDEGYLRKSEDKLTVEKDNKKLFYQLNELMWIKFGSDKQFKPYLSGNNGFDTKRYARCGATDKYTIVDHTKKGDGFEVRFNVAEKSTKRWSSFYHTLPAHGDNDEVYCLGLTPEQMEQGKIISYFDISQMEPRTLAYNSNCKNFIKSYEEGKDVYVGLARIHYPNAPEDELKKRRGEFKRLNLGLTYGMGVKSLAASLGCSEEDAVSLTATYFGQFPEIKEYIENCRNYMKTHEGRIWTLFGDKAQGRLSSASTQALNYRIQGGASLLASSGFWNCATAAKKLGMYCNPMGVIHDSCQNIIDIKNLVYMEQIYERYFTGYCYDLMKIKYKYDLEICTSFRDHIELKPYDFENRVLTIKEGNIKDVKYIIDNMAKAYAIEVENFEYHDTKYVDALDRWAHAVPEGPKAHRYYNGPELMPADTCENVKIHFEYDFNDDFMKEIKTRPFDTFKWNELVG